MEEKKIESLSDKLTEIRSFPGCQWGSDFNIKVAVGRLKKHLEEVHGIYKDKTIDWIFGDKLI